MQLADYLRYSGGLAEAEVQKIEEEDGLATVELLGWPLRTDRA